MTVLILAIGLMFGWYFAFNKEDEILDEDNSNYIIAAFINGEASTTFPTTKDYIADVTCKKGSTEVDIGAKVAWTGTKWKLSVDDASVSDVACNIKFVTKPTWSSPGTGTLLAAIKSNNTVKSPTTTPGTTVSSSTEALLASTADDYGTSYYFRGSVTNNYVEYANMCWRIVRVTGDGSIKLVLYNYNGLTDSNNTPDSVTPCSETGSSLAFARYSGTTLKTAFNSNYSSNSDVGFMYGIRSGSSYALAHANYYPSTILGNLSNWYKNVLSKQSTFSDSLLADTIWCNDKSTVSDTTYDPFSVGSITGLGYATNKTYYGTTQRILSSSRTAGGTGPSLICPNDNNGGKLSKFTVSDTEYGNGALSKLYKIGLLTADEIVFAGNAFYTTGSTYYLNQNATSNYWWTLSPGGFNGSSASNWDMDNGDKTLVYAAVNGPDQGIRPSLALLSTTKITSGDGTASNPYRIAS